MLNSNKDLLSKLKNILCADTNVFKATTVYTGPGSPNPPSGTVITNPNHINWIYPFSNRDMSSDSFPNSIRKQYPLSLPFAGPLTPSGSYGASTLILQNSPDCVSSLDRTNSPCCFQKDNNDNCISFHVELDNQLPDAFPPHPNNKPVVLAPVWVRCVKGTRSNLPVIICTPIGDPVIVISNPPIPPSKPRPAKPTPPPTGGGGGFQGRGGGMQP